MLASDRPYCVHFLESILAINYPIENKKVGNTHFKIAQSLNCRSRTTAEATTVGL